MQICLVALALLLVALHAPTASAAPVPQLRKLAQLPGGTEGRATITWDTINCNRVDSFAACDGVSNLPSRACCNQFGCTANFDQGGSQCASDTFLGCCPGLQVAPPRG
jgi:hypothetical protein